MNGLKSKAVGAFFSQEEDWWLLVFEIPTKIKKQSPSWCYRTLVCSTYWKKNTQYKLEGAQGKQFRQTWFFLNWSHVIDIQKSVPDLRTQTRVFWHHNSQWWWEDKVNLPDLSWSTIWAQTVPQLSCARFPGKSESQDMEPFLNESDSILIKLISASSAKSRQVPAGAICTCPHQHLQKGESTGFSSHNCYVWSSEAPYTFCLTA